MARNKLPDLSLELALLGRGVRPVAGADEAGRGPLAGPVVAAAVVLPPELTGREEWLWFLDDSKRLSASRREEAFEAVQEHALAWAAAVVDSTEIDRIGVGVAALRAMLSAVDSLSVEPAHLLLDYIPVRDCRYPYDTLVKGDSRSYSIAAASNVAKVTRDRMMADYELSYPGYGFARHKGYATAFHLERLREIGPCDIHRRSFAPVARPGLICESSPPREQPRQPGAVGANARRDSTWRPMVTVSPLLTFAAVPERLTSSPHGVRNWSSWK